MNAARSIGRMRARVTIEAPVETIDDTGARSIVYQGVGDVFAQISRANFALRDDLAGETARMTHRFRLRWRDDLAPGWRLRIMNGVFVIRVIAQEDERARFLLCDCEQSEMAGAAS